MLQEATEGVIYRRGGEECRGSKSDSRMGGRDVEARSYLWRSCTQEFYEFRPFSEEVTALRLGARRRSTGLYACVLQRVPTTVPEEGGGLYRVRQTPPALSYEGFKVHKDGDITGNSCNKDT